MKIIIAGVVSGLLLALSYPPLEWSWLVWIALVPLLWAMHSNGSSRTVFFAGFATGLAFYLISLFPLTSGHEWTGWMVESGPEARQALIERQTIILKILWVVLAAWGAVFWGVFAWLSARLSKGSPVRLSMLAPPLVILITEWLRSVTTWDYQWAFIGNAAIPFEPVLQLSALGGVWLMTWFVVLVNVGIFALLKGGHRQARRAIPSAIAAVVLLVMLGGQLRVASFESRLQDRDDGFLAAAVQFYQKKTTVEDYASFGLENAYLEILVQLMQGAVGEVELIVLPESVAIGTLSLDGSVASGIPEQRHWSLDHWNQAVNWILEQGETDPTIVIGLDTVEAGRLHNSLGVWEREGLLGVYHKQRLVPFGEYQPSVFRFFGVRGRTQYAAGGDSSTTSVTSVKVGHFVCQEVLIPSVIRHSVKDGAELLVSGGNDGVFSNGTVAQIHARLARLRAVESGRFVVRSMRTGISAIISPVGREVARSQKDEPYVAVAEVYPFGARTPYVRLGDWPLVGGFLVLLISLTSGFRAIRTPLG